MDKGNGEWERFSALLDKHKESDETGYLKSLNIVVGNSNHEKYVQQMGDLGKKVLFLTGNRAMRHYKFLDLYLRLFEENGFDVRHYDNISSNPTLKQMEGGIDIAKAFKPDFIFALGGGSVIDTAKVISAGFFGDVWEFVEKKEKIKKATPIVASATTSGTGSQLTPYAVITNTDTLEKKTLKHEKLLPKLSISDVDIVRCMPRPVIASTGFDVMCHAAEVYTRSDCTEAGRDFAVRALELVREHLVASYNHDAPENKVGMIYADMYAGIALSLIGTHVPHAISHPISARFPNINHGMSLAYITAETARKMIEKGNSEVNEKFRHISEVLGGSTDFVRTVLNYAKLLDMGRKHEFTKADCESIYLDTIGYRKTSVDRSPVRLDDVEVREIIYTALRE
jgi:alcohol dehydrogenase class IV